MARWIKFADEEVSFLQIGFHTAKRWVAEHSVLGASRNYASEEDAKADAKKHLVVHAKAQLTAYADHITALALLD